MSGGLLSPDNMWDEIGEAGHYLEVVANAMFEVTRFVLSGLLGQNLFATFVLIVTSVLFAYSMRGIRTDCDPVRLFTKAQKRQALVNCGGRCEHKRPLLPRCHAKHDLQGDHIYPWSKGGATIEANLQMLCPKHNRRKTNLVPSRLYIWRLERRRSHYFPAGVSPKVRWKANGSTRV